MRLRRPNPLRHRLLRGRSGRYPRGSGSSRNAGGLMASDGCGTPLPFRRGLAMTSVVRSSRAIRAGRLLLAPLALALLSCGVAPQQDETTEDEAGLRGSRKKPKLCDPSACGRDGGQMIACPDGSKGGFTGRCLRQQNQCVWEYRECPTVKCGALQCPAGQVCCNASCGVCTAPGGYCDARVCEPAECTPTECGPALDSPSCVCADGSPGCNTGVCKRDGATGQCGWEYRVCPPPAPSQCGSVQCRDGQVCCNASCGLCTEPGGYCTGQVCP